MPAATVRSVPARILIARHGQSTWNAERRWQGQEDPPLSTIGVRQAREAAAVVGSFDLVAASPLQRALTTATIIADALGVGPVQTDADLMERHAGGFQGLTRPEIDIAFPGYLVARRRPDDWEPDESVVQRAVEALARVATAIGDDGTALVISHGGVITCLERLVGIARDDRLANLGGRWFEVGPGVLRGGEEVVLVDPTSITVPDQI